MSADETPVDRAQITAALEKAITFYHDQCAKHGGYVWRYSRDLALSEGEAETGPDSIWVQPPGTPAVGQAMLEAYDVTGEARYLEVAREAAHALVRGQLQSGGWHYGAHFDPAERVKWGYRDNAEFRVSSKRKNSTNITTLDDDTTPGALRFLIAIDKRLKFEDAAIHEAAQFALEALLKAQYPNGGWYQNWDRYPQPPSADEYPILEASFPRDWSRKWLNDWPGRYYTNDNVTGNMIATMLDAWEVYGDDRFLNSAKRTGDFLLLAQMPDPQPAWAQQYDPAMYPCWDRKFEPPAISGHESQEVIRALLMLTSRSGERRFLEPIPRTLAYLRQSLLPDGRLARFYELQTNRPLYMTDDYQLAYDVSDAPTHYGWVFDSELEDIAALYERVISDGPLSVDKPSTNAEVRAVIDALDERGAWIDPRGMKGFRKASQEGVIQSETFIANVGLLCDALRGAQE